LKQENEYWWDGMGKRGGLLLFGVGREMMTDRSDLILQNFGYLITEFGFSIAEKEFDPSMMGNAFIIFKSSQIGIEIVIDRNQVLIALGDPTEPRKKWAWFKNIRN
jgi:hypothetical protein